jgi:hypothetical protein
VSFLDALGKQGNAHEVQQLLNSVTNQQPDLPAGTRQTIADALGYLQWFEQKCAREHTKNTNWLRAENCTAQE